MGPRRHGDGITLPWAHACKSSALDLWDRLYKGGMICCEAIMSANALTSAGVHSTCVMVQIAINVWGTTKQRSSWRTLSAYQFSGDAPLSGFPAIGTESMR